MSALDRDRLARLAADLRSGDLSPFDYLDRLAGRFDEREREVRAFLPEDGRFERLRREAETLVSRYPDESGRPPLFCVPIGVKDIFRVDGFETRAGSRLPPEELAGAQAEVVSLLREAGALILGKTVTTEFAYFQPGATRNPYDLERTPGGSSSGSAAAVGARLCPLALGTQTIGSVGRPASYCGVVGFKPSFGRFSLQGVIPLAPSLDHVGLFTHDVAGVRLVSPLLDDEWDERAIETRRPVLGIPEGTYLEHADAEALVGYRGCLDRLSAQGYEVRSARAFPDFSLIDTHHRMAVAAEAAHIHADWYETHGELYGPKTAELIERGETIHTDELSDALEGGRELRTVLADLMDERGIDLWVAPSAPGPAPRGLDSTGDPVMNLPWTYAGVPALTLPAWRVGALPMGLQVCGRWQADEQLLAWGEAIEEALAR
jgi:Asp-tRNA(Asn)/Glu-tRNA(Gln) amidotransferase A subunit family amidase